MMSPDGQQEDIWKRKVEKLQKKNDELEKKLKDKDAQLKRQKKKLAVWEQDYETNMRKIEQLEDENEKLEVKVDRWKTKAGKLEDRNERLEHKLEKQVARSERWKAKKEEFERMNEESISKLDEMKENMVLELQKVREELEQKEKAWQAEEKKMTEQLKKAERMNRSNVIKIAQLTTALSSSKLEVCSLKKERDELQKMYQLGFGGCDENDRAALVQYLLNYQQELKSQSESADMQCKEFSRLNNHQFDSVIAESELLNFLLETEASRQKVERNLKLLEEHPDTALMLLHKMRPLPSTVFSDETIKKMEEALKAALEESMTECVICIEVLRNDQRMFTCMQCTNKFHFECYTEWARQAQTCPLCRQATPNSIPHNIAA